ncbi:MAG TPA: plastocyanin/azurin family copper-binding protein [Solirubrobacteraceae bacterium]|nr:plastocyanin/azurin family copper-binding protein [Solirubrobacteraceae bacterium]
MFRIPMIALAGVLLALVLAACGDDKESNSGRGFDDDAATVTTNPTPEVQTSTQSDAEESDDIVSVGMKDIKFVPEEIEAKVGQKIVWTNNEAIPHNVTATDGADFASDTMQKDDTFEYTPREAGAIKYVCTIHQGQNGQITVTQ